MADRTLFVLGAGASRGLEKPGHQPPPLCDPPLNADFFTQLQRITDSKHRDVVETVINDLLDFYGSNFSATLEEYFTQLEFLTRIVDLSGSGASKRTERFEEMRSNLMAALSTVLEESTDTVIRGGGCARHKKLVKCLKGGDTIISFNYDCLIDDALKREGHLKWNPRYGYCFPLRGYKLVGEKYWCPATPAVTKAKTIRLLKVHGSLHWQLPTKGNQIKLKQRVHTQRGTPKFSIVPPVWNKAISAKDIIGKVWTEAAAAIKGAHTIIVIGLSFAPTDLYAQSLFRVSLSGIGLRTSSPLKLKRLILVDPEPRTRKRIRGIFDEALLDGAIVRQYDTLEQLVDALPQALD